MKHAAKGLLALLQSPYKKRLAHRSWSQILLDDIYSLISASGSRLTDLGDPQLFPHGWASCMREHPWMMKRLADGFLRSHAKASPVSSPTSLPTKYFPCGTCGKQFSTLQAAYTHEWSVHRRRQIGADYTNKHVASVAACRAEMALPQEISRRSQRHTGRSLTTLIVSKLVPPGNLASVYTDHIAYELYDPSLLPFYTSCAADFCGSVEVG